MKNPCAIVEDLLPLYVDELLSEETKEWVEEHLEQCERCRENLQQMKGDLPIKEAKGDTGKILMKVNRKIATFQMLFVIVSFLLAMSTSLMLGSFQFILTYTILGFVTYLFYRDMRIVSLVAFVPNFLWNIGSYLFIESEKIQFIEAGFIKGISALLFGAFLYAVIHYLFALIGSWIAMLILKIRGENRG